MLRRTALNHVPGLDGLRGLAVAGVLLFHSGGLLRGGYLGVDLFFVLSGFLITSLLVAEERATGRIDLRAFWIRRARRLLPALLSLMPAIALYAKLFAQPGELRMLRADALATLGYVANWRAILAHRSYWEMFVAPSPLEHTWSLAIEEQFYLVWPLVVVGVMAVARREKARALVLVSLVLTGVSMLAMVLLAGNPTRVYMGTDTRGAAILMGAALGASGLTQPSQKGARALQGAGCVAVLVLAIAWLRLDGQSEWLYRGGFWLTELAALVLVACATRVPGGLVARGLSFAPFRRLGEISYGVYLWHWPIYVVLSEERTGLSSWRLLAARLLLTLVVAIVSYRFFERPIRQNGVKWGRPIYVVPSAITLVIAVVVASTRTVGATIPPVGFVAAPLPPPPPVRAEAPPPTNVLVVGDSVGIALGGRMGWDGKPENFLVEQRAVGDCSILQDIVPVRSMSGLHHGNPNCAASWKEDAAEVRPDIFVVVIGGAYFATVQVGGRWRRACDSGYHDAYAKRLGELLEAVKPFAKRRVVVLAAYPVGKWQNPTRNTEVDCFNQALRDGASAADAEVLDLNPWLCPDHTCTMKSKDLPVRPDGLHFDGPGAEETSHWVIDRLREGPR